MEPTCPICAALRKTYQTTKTLAHPISKSAVVSDKNIFLLTLNENKRASNGKRTVVSFVNKASMKKRI